MIALGEVRALTGIERDAMSLALRLLRVDQLFEALIPLEIVGDLGSEGCATIERAATAQRRSVYVRVRWTHAEARRVQREARVRLALYLRARLRADRGDCGPETYTRTGRLCRDAAHYQTAEGLCIEAACGCLDAHRRITPLWQRAGEARR